MEYISSSEEAVIPSFVEARRSKRYMSKRTSGTFRDYLRSRSNESEECSTTTFNANNNNNNNNNNENSNGNNSVNNNKNNGKNNSINSNINKKDKENRINTLPSQKSRNKKETLFKRNSARSSYSSYINNMHGLRTRTNSEQIIYKDELNDKDIYKTNYNSINNRTNGKKDGEDGISNDDGVGDVDGDDDDDDEDDGDCDNVCIEDEDNDEVFSNKSSSSSYNYNSNNHAFRRQSTNSSFLKKYNAEDVVMQPKVQFESTDDWYASASDMDESDSALSKPYGYNAVNPVLECVNQVSL